jgi:hypothetical protein
MAHLLLEHRANSIQCDSTDRPSYSAIHAARSEEMAQHLLDHHADPEQQVGEGFRPLHFDTARVISRLGGRFCERVLKWIRLWIRPPSPSCSIMLRSATSRQ